MSKAPVRVHVQHDFASDPETVFEKLSEHENLGRVFGAKITRIKDGNTSRNGVGSARRLNIGPLPSFVETVTAAQPNSLIEYEITEGSPLRGHYGIQTLTPAANGGTHLDYKIGFDMPIPGVASLIGAVLTRQVKAGLPKLVD